MCRAYKIAFLLLLNFMIAKSKIVQNNELMSMSVKSIVENSTCAKDSYDKYDMEIEKLKGLTNEFRTKLIEMNERLGKVTTTFKNTLNEVRSRITSPTNSKTIASCSETLLRDDGTLSGVYRLKVPDTDLPAFSVLCLKDPNNGPAWTVFQRRQDGSIDFYRGWKDYEIGFGNLYGEFWLGLERIHAITASQKHELWIQFDDFEGGSHYAKYDAFLVGDKKSKYELLKVGTFHGTGQESLKTHTNQKFTTKDSDNDESESTNCAIYYKGAWWYQSCYQSNLNGAYSTESNGTTIKGIQWNNFRGSYNLKYVHMAIRPIIKK